MSKTELLKALDELAKKIDDKATKEIQNLDSEDQWSNETLFKTLDLMEAQAIKADEAIQWVKQMVEENL